MLRLTTQHVVGLASLYRHSDDAARRGRLYLREELSLRLLWLHLLFCGSTYSTYYGSTYYDQVGRIFHALQQEARKIRRGAGHSAHAAP